MVEEVVVVGAVVGLVAVIFLKKCAKAYSANNISYRVDLGDCIFNAINKKITTEKIAN